MVCYFTYVLGIRVNKYKKPPSVNQPNKVNKTMTIQHSNFFIRTLSILKQNKSRITLSCISTTPRADLPYKSERMVMPFNLGP